MKKSKTNPATATATATATSTPTPRAAATTSGLTTTTVHFTLPYLPAQNVFLAGSFNEWRPGVLRLDEDHGNGWTLDLPLPPGAHEYLFVVDGHWIADPNNPRTVPNPFGGHNSIIEVSFPQLNRSPPPTRFTPMKSPSKPARSAASKSSARVVVTDRAGHKVASAPLAELAPVRFHIRNILVPVDFSDHSRKALRYARPFAEQFGASLTLLHIIEPMVYPTDFGYASIAPPDLDEQRMDKAQQQLKELATELGATVPVESLVRLGRAWKEIVDAAQVKASDLLIISTHGYTGLKYALLGSVAEKIVRHAPCPVLVVRSEEHDFV